MTDKIVKFSSTHEARMFCLEEGLSYDTKIEDGDYGKFISVDGDILEARFLTKSRIKDLDRSRNSKRAWRLNRRKYLKGIRKYHKSTEGKRFHRKLGRLNATRDYGDKYEDLNELAVGVQSLLTHMLIEESYNSTINEESSFELMHEYVQPILSGFCTELLRAVHSRSSIDLDKYSEEFDIINDLINGVDGQIE